MDIYFAIAVLQGDYDAIGSKGQNKLVSDGVLFGIDFGHFGSDNPLVVAIDFMLSIVNDSYKNYSIFFDMPRSQLMKGFLLLAKLSGKVVSKKIVNAYADGDESFLTLFNSLEKNQDINIYVEFINMLREMQSQQPVFSSEIDGYILKLTEVKDALKANRKRLVDKLYPLMLLPPTIVNTMRNFEVLFAAVEGNVSLLSEDHSVLLTRLRIVKDPAIKKWAIHYSQDKEFLFLFATFANMDRAQHVVDTVLAEDSLPSFIKGGISNDGEIVRFAIPVAEISDFKELMPEAMLQQRYCKSHYDLRVRFNQTLASLEVAVDMLKAQAIEVKKERWQIRLVWQSDNQSHYIRELLTVYQVKSAGENECVIPMTEADLNLFIERIQTLNNGFSLQKGRLSDVVLFDNYVEKSERIEVIPGDPDSYQPAFY